MGNQIYKNVSDIGNHELQTNFTFDIDNFSEKKAPIRSPTFLCNGYEWCVEVDPEENDYDDYLRMYLRVLTNTPIVYLPGWRMRANYTFVLSNQSGKELHRAEEVTSLFCLRFPAWGGDRTLPLSKLREEGFLENNKLIVKVEMKEVERDVNGKDLFDIKGFEVPSSQVMSVSWLFAQHPDIATDFKPMPKGVKTAYMNLLIDLIETLRKAPQRISETELSNAHSDLKGLIEAGFKLDWLKTKLEEVSIRKKNAVDEDARVKKLEARIKNLEVTLSGLKVELDKDKAKSAAAAAKILLFEDIV